MAESDTATTQPDPTIVTPSFPSGRIKKIMKLDKDISKINSEALFLVSCSADLFLSFLTERSAREAAAKKRKIVRVEHMLTAVRTHRPTSDFLLDSLPKEAVPVQQTKEKAKEKEKEKEKELPRGTQKIDRFFKKGV